MNITRKLATALAIALGVFCAGAAAEARDFRLGTIVPAGHLWSKHAEIFGDKLAKASGGAHSVSVFPAGQLGNESQMMQQLQTGALDMAFLTIAELSNRDEAFGALYAPFLVDNAGDAGKLLQSPSAQALLKGLPRKMGVVGVGYGIATMRQMMSTSPIESVADLAGKKMRITPFKAFRDLYNIIGIAPTPMPLPDVYDALANGQVDAIDVDVELIVNFRFDQRAKHLLVTNHAMFPMVGLVSARVWKDLSADEREMVRTAMKEALDELIAEYADREPKLLEQVRATGIEVTPVTAEFFPGVVAKWEEMWASQKPLIDKLRAEAAAL